jgi:hypothetical protein
MFFLHLVWKGIPESLAGATAYRISRIRHGHRRSPGRRLPELLSFGTRIHRSSNIHRRHVDDV